MDLFKNILSTIKTTFFPSSPNQSSTTQEPSSQKIQTYTITASKGLEEKLIALFEEVFQTPMTKEFWNWKYKFSEEYNFALVNGDNEVVGSYGGIGRDLLVFGEQTRSVQVCDIMIAQKARGGKRKKSRLYQLVSTFCETNVGKDRPYFLVYGFPNRRHMKVAEIFNLYTETDTVLEHRWESKDTQSPLQYERVSHKHKDQIDQLWKQMADEFQKRIIGVRDYNYLQYRYMEHPVFDYKLFILFDETKQAVGVVIGKIEETKFRLMDIVGLEKEYSLIIQSLQTIVSTLECDHISFWLTTSQANHFNICDGISEDIDISIATYSHINSCNLEDIEKKWWLTSGDTDFM